jgi:hypothetical protein
VTFHTARTRVPCEVGGRRRRATPPADEEEATQVSCHLGLTCSDLNPPLFHAGVQRQLGHLRDAVALLGIEGEQRQRGSVQARWKVQLLHPLPEVRHIPVGLGDLLDQDLDRMGFDQDAELYQRVADLRDGLAPFGGRDRTRGLPAVYGAHVLAR